MTNLSLMAKNCRETYLKIEWLQNCVAKRIKRGQLCTVEHLAECATMKLIIREAAKNVIYWGGETPTREERREAAVELAENILEQAEYIVNE